MHRRLLSSLTLVTATTLGLVACASDSDVSTKASGSTPVSTSTTVPKPSYPTDPDVALITIGRPGELSRVLIGGDGWVYFPADLDRSPVLGIIQIAPAAIPPPPAPTGITRRKLTDAGLDAVMAFAAAQGLAATPPEYEDPGVTDMGTTEVTITDSNGTYVHDAYALGFEDETGARKRLLDFVDAAADIETLVGKDEIGPIESYVPTMFVVTVGGSYVDDSAAVDWPSGVPVEAGCIALPVDQFPDGVAGVYFADVDGASTRVLLVPDLPGDDCH
jgi:hypothetical protein